MLANSGHGADDIGMHLINPSVPLAPAPEPPEARTEVAVARSVLENYVGEYELAPNFSITVSHQGEGLMLQATGQPSFPIFAESETEFFLKVIDGQITFVLREDGVVTGMILRQGGADQSARKVR